jgi:Protein of unknown function (DUF4054)
MPYTVPTVAEFETKFPAIVATPEAIQMWLDTAAMMVDNTWYINDYQPAILFLAAHYLTTALALEAAAALGGGAGGGGGSTGSTDTASAGPVYLSSVSIEGRTVSFRQGGTSSSTRASQAAGAGITSQTDAALRRSLYGQIFIELRRRNVIPILTV